MITVGIVDDKIGLRRSFERLFNSVPGFRCILACASGEEALEVVVKKVPDVLLMDIEMQGMSGIECTARLKQLLPKLRIIMVTVCDDDIKVFQALRAGAIGYLLKRSTSEEMVEAVRDAVKGGAPMSRDIALKVVEAFHQPPATETVDAKLSPREREVLELISQGLSNKEVVDLLKISMDTLRQYLKSIYEKLHVHCRTDAVIKHLGRKPSV
jgi:DNA-binding NarL/FixJ family response regulator